MELNDGVLTAARIVVGGAFAIIGVRNVGNHKPISEMIRANRFPMPEFLAATGIAMQIGFGVLMMIGLFPVVSALGLLAFTIVATLMAHSFWMFGRSGPCRSVLFLATWSWSAACWRL